MLRTRVALTTVALLAVGLLGTAMVSAWSIHSVANQRTQSNLASAAAQAGAVLTLVDTGPGADPAPIEATLGAVLSRNEHLSFGAVVDARGRTLATSGAVPEAALTRAGAVRTADGRALPADTVRSYPYRSGPSRVPAGDERTLVRVLRVSGGATLVVGSRTGATDALVRTVLTTILSVPIVALVATGLASWWLVRRGLRPLARIADSADGVSLEDVGQRIAVPEGFGEGRQVAQALNRMLDRIGTALRERDASEERLRRFVDDASHELRTPIATIRGYAELFRRGVPAEDLALVIGRIESEAQRMGLLVDDLLALAALDRDHAPVIAPVDLVAVATDAAAAAAVAGASGLTVHAPDPVTVSADPVGVRRILDNLLANAARHTPPGTPAEVRVSVEDSGDVLLAVVDSGPGLPDPDRVFERFYRGGTRSPGPSSGAGLGLAIVAAIAAAHGWSVVARNMPIGGALVGVKIEGEGVQDRRRTPDGGGKRNDGGDSTVAA
ncbi:sensor histidine kinase [Cryptosporangium phraense]|nr:ATP-binding protein [Cryptosporangium phraense]